jgi:hypothetical protein
VAEQARISDNQVQGGVWGTPLWEPIPDQALGLSHQQTVRRFGPAAHVTRVQMIGMAFVLVAYVYSWAQRGWAK